MALHQVCQITVPLNCRTWLSGQYRIPKDISSNSARMMNQEQEVEPKQCVRYWGEYGGITALITMSPVLWLGETLLCSCHCWRPDQFLHHFKQSWEDLIKLVILFSWLFPVEEEKIKLLLFFRSVGKEACRRKVII